MAALLLESDLGGSAVSDRVQIATSVQAKDDSQLPEVGLRKPLLMVDIDGVVSLFGFASPAQGEQLEVAGSFHSIDGIPHFLSSTAAAHLLALEARFDLVWASGWEEKANEHLPHLLGLPASLPFLRFGHRVRGTRTTHAHWKLDAIDAYAQERPLAWIDDAFNPACHAWADERQAPTLLISTAPEQGLTARETEQLKAWAKELQTSSAGR